MTSFSRTAGGIGAGLLTVAALTAATPAAQARSAAKAAVVNVPCNSATLATEIGNANTAMVPTTLRLASYCVYSLTAQLPQITGNITMVGGPNTSLRRPVTALTTFRILDVAFNATLRVDGIFILNGSSPATLGNGAGIQNAGNLVLNHVTLSGNKATTTFVGGGLYNAATGVALVARSVIMGNATTGTGDGGGIYNAGSLTVYQSRVAGNVSANNGGGIYTTVAPATTRLVQSTISGNHAQLGGGLHNSGTTTLDRTLVALNRAQDTTATGGGIFNNTGGTVTLSNSIVSKNTPVNCEPAISGCTG